MMNKLFLFLLLLAPAMVAGQVSFSVLGDSYSTFEGFVEPDTNEPWYVVGRKGNDVQSARQCWWYLLADSLNLRIEKNNSYSGSTISYTGYKNGATGRHENYKPRSFVTRAPNLGSPDIILVFGGTNDSWCGAPIGDYKYADWTEEDMFSFRPALAKLLDYMTTRYVNCKIYFILNTELKDEVDESVGVICGRYGVPVIELKDVDKQQGHPSVAGMRSIMKQVADFIY